MAWLVTYQFLAAMIDTLTEHIVVIDRQGKILYVNKSWCHFAQENNHPNPADWIGKSYLKACNAPATDDGELGGGAADGLLRVINKEQDSFISNIHATVQTKCAGF
jgi:transcriptional regulator with PAS, ATPase and Fis domain